jgi:hypothetical protein
MTSGAPSNSQYTVEPQAGQKRNMARPPLSPVRAKVDAFPSSVTCSRRKRPCTLKTLPVRR